MMRRIAFLRSIEVQQAAPYLDALRDLPDGAEARLFYTDGHCGPEDFPGTAERLKPDITPDELADRLLEWGADGVISLSIPDEHAMRDALVKELLADAGVPVVMTGADATHLLSDKWETKRLLTEHDLVTPEGLLIDGDLLNSRALPVPAYATFLRWKAAQLGYPVLCKPLWDCMGNGISFLAGPEDLDRYLLNPHDGNVVMERCVSGELCSVEILGRPGDYLVQPLCWMGPAGGEPEFAFGQLRYSAPRPAADAAFAPVAERLTKLCTRLGVHGAVDVDMIYSGGTYHILEINPRVSGATSLSIAGSSVNTYAQLVKLLDGTWSAAQAAASAHRRLAFQFPVAELTAERLAAARARLNVVRANDFHIGGRTHPNMLITCEFADAPALGAALDGLQAQHGLTTPDVIAGIKELTARALAERQEEAHRVA
ncbi:ATP-grasp domain-containing protein [Streptomyces sp. ISL-22]|nr:ATP-grasp domain-containing protein [Streptomyces sp. ISL-24]MBT2437523.1 ATP-grasp domain-containing protein [Streptomyces sp. ISL-22]